MECDYFLKPYVSILEGWLALMEPVGEVVIHDIRLDKVVYIKGFLSNRAVGDPSLINPSECGALKERPFIYSKINFNGKILKSVSMMLNDHYLLCMNLDMSVFSQMHALSAALLSMPLDEPPNALFSNDWQEKVNQVIHAYLKEHHLCFDHLSLSSKKLLVRHLFDKGAFSEKNAADYIAKALQLGRATIFNYLRQWRNA